MAPLILGADFWLALTELHQWLLQQEKVNNFRKTCRDDPNSSGLSVFMLSDNNDSRQQVLQRIEGTVTELLSSVASGDVPVLSYNCRSMWSNLRFDENVGLEMLANSTKTSVRFDSLPSVNKFALMLKTMSLIYKLVQTNSFSTKRDMYYQHTKLFGSQATLNDIVDNISCMLEVPRWNLHVLATSKGCIAGDLQYTESDSSFVDCSTTPSGVLIPNNVEGVSNMHSQARFVLVIEKDATFQKLMDDELCKTLGPCILITGKGVPDMNTRLMVRKLWDTFHVPTLLLVDADPYGMEIMCIYKFGSKSLSFESRRLTVPSIRWLGVLPSDIKRLHIPEDVLIPMTDADLQKASELQQRPYFNQQELWQKEMQIMLDSNLKAEIQCLVSISPTFLSEVYLPNKIRFGGWI